MMPPLITVGSRSPASSKAATIEVVVVLPWGPAIATQLFSPPPHGNALRPRPHQFGIVALDRGRHHQHIGAGDVLGLVADIDGDALVAQTADIAAFGSIRALHGVAEIAQHLGNAAHADAADTDEVNGSDFARQSHGLVPWRHPPRKRRPGISRASTIQISRAGYWMPRFRGA